MNAPLNNPLATARELHDTFNRSFAALRAPSRAPAEELLLVRTGGRRYALKVSELRGLHPGRRITPLPSARTALLGLVGIRGQLIPTYSLAALLDAADGRHDHRWLVICQPSNVAVALAFEEFAGSARVPASDLHAPPSAGQLPEHIAHVARIPPENCYVINTASLLKAIIGQTDEGPAAGENATNSTGAHATGR